MADINETIQESIDQAGKSMINSRVALLVAITATFMALCNVKDGNIVQAMSQAQAHAIDAWSYFQAKSTKQAIAENSVELLKLQSTPASEVIIKKYEEKIANYEKEKTAIKAQAEGFQKEYEDINLFDDQFDMTEAFLTISIAMLGITSQCFKSKNPKCVSEDPRSIADNSANIPDMSAFISDLTREGQKAMPKKYRNLPDGVSNIFISRVSTLSGNTGYTFIK